MHTLRCFGRVGVEGAGGEIVRLRSSKHLALLVYLVANPDHEHPRERLAPLFWETERSQARHSLSQALYDIRSNLPELGVRASVNHVAVRRGTVVSELDLFEKAVRSSDVARAVELYRGVFVPDLESVATEAFERWVEDERQRLQRLAELAFCRYVTECDDRARWGEMCTVALRLLDMNPLHEEAHRAFMRGMWLQGDQQAALDHFRQVESMLSEELPSGISPETHRLLERIRSSRPDLRRAEPGRPDRPRMVGRRKEFARLKRDLRRLEGGHGGVVVIRGEAGIGKTRLLEEIRELARLHGVSLLESRCFAAETDVSYGPIVDGLYPIARDRAGRSDGGAPTFYQLGVLFPEQFPRSATHGEGELEADAGRRRLYEETAALLRMAADQKPRLWIVEDLHWVDASSASLLHYVSRRLRDHALLVLVSIRSGQDVDEATDSLLHDWCGQSEATCIDLEGLSDAEMAELIEEVRPTELSDPQVDFIRRLASGNPFFALQMASAAADLQEWCPEAISSRHLLTESLETLLGVRLKGLGLEPVRLLETVAVLERHATPFVVARTSSLSTGRVAEIARTLYARGLLHDAEGRLEFPHDLTREYVYGNMGELQRAALHLVAGEVLAGSEEAVSPSTLARHFELGGDRPRAYEYALRAAEQSALGYAHDEAIALSRLAISQATSGEERAAGLRILAESESASGSLTAAESHLKELVDLAVLQPEETIAIKLKIARARVELSQFRSAELMLDEVEGAIQGLQSCSRTGLEAEVLHWRLKSAMMRGDIREADKAVSALETALPILTGSGSHRATAVGLYSLAGHALFTMSIDRAAQYCNQALDVLGDCDADLLLRLKTLNGAILTRSMEWTSASRIFASALAEAKRLNDVRHILALLNNLACCHLEQGSWAEVSTLHATFGRFAAGLSETISSRADIDLNLANSLFYQGQARAAAATLEGLLATARRIGKTSVLLEMEALRGLVYAQLGRRSNMRECHDLIADLSRTDLGTIQDRFKVYWLKAFVARCAGTDSPSLWDEAVSIDERSDRVGHLKLLWLQTLFASDQPAAVDPTTDPAGRRLLDAGLRWFAYFARRWMIQASGNKALA
jgi:DNA-binding SARP family transcriptional activator/tetratricopeptide (TPR) repeat protein